ncbi:MAG: hypothetical protein ACRDO1_18340 [Nocardioidaceae bacterium]
MSDLQCAATFVISGAVGESEARTLASSLTSRRIAQVYGDAAHRPAAELVAGILEVQAVVRDDLDPDLGHAGGLAALADVHRGETVLVLVRRPSDPATVELSIDGDGWAWRPSAGDVEG